MYVLVYSTFALYFAITKITKIHLIYWAKPNFIWFGCRTMYIYTTLGSLVLRKYGTYYLGSMVLGKYDTLRSFQIFLHFLALLISLKASMYILLYIFYTVRHVNVCYFVAKIVLRKNCPSDRENLLKFKTKVREFAKYLRSLKHLKVGQ